MPRNSRWKLPEYHGSGFHTGPHCVRYADDERMIALPVDRLWSGDEA